MTICEQIKFVMVITRAVDGVSFCGTQADATSGITPQIYSLVHIQGICGYVYDDNNASDALARHGNCANS